ncbi:MFS transporter [Marinactinospora thermotolerans]|uniref:MFS transporter, DHA2 family, multidrug resistance protein n=1 Tax=Marinactinospora thermotolerans DSM 45154 TaxID=1122192 RepID=A0A1T4KLX7_9ACTN|nr:MFS transporter [Marinactinospora thermotolerans]SJZ43405.1 MFS transporter, DHA2 family, multidrug resistance protein [Marinactinospora thermotolerans DSM 45154]
MTTAPSSSDIRQRRGRWWAFSTLVLAVLLIAVDGTVLGMATPFISEDLAPTGTQLLWIGDIYSFVLAGLLVTMGSLGDRIGRKKLLLTGATAFGLFSALTAYAPTAEALILGRALLGVAGATLMPSTLALIRSLFPDPAERSTAIGIWAAATSGGAAFGPVLGGLLLENFWWGSVFLINVPVMALLLPVGIKLLPESKNPDPGPWDLPSVGLSMVGMIGVVYAIKETAAHGLSAGTAAAALVGVFALVLFVRRQVRLPSPLIDVRLFANRAFSGVIGANLLSVLGMSGLVYFLSQFFQLVQGYSPFVAGLAELPAVVASMGSGLVAGWLVRRSSVRVVLSGGMATMGGALALLVLLTPDSGYALMAVSLFLVGVGMGLAFAVANDVILSSVPKDQAGAASAVSETAYELGMALGIAVLGSIITGVYQRFEVPPGMPAAAVSDARGSLGGAAEAAAALPAEQAQALLDAARAAFTTGLASAAAIGALLLLAAAAASWVMLKNHRPGEGAPSGHG